jgi:hypothetical protein
LADLAAHIAAVVTAAEEAAMYSNYSDSPYASDEEEEEDEEEFTSETSSISGVNSKIFSDNDEIVPLPRRGIVDSNVRLTGLPAVSRADPPPGASPRSLPPPPGLVPQIPIEFQNEMARKFPHREILIPSQLDSRGPALGLDIFARTMPPLSPMQPPMPHGLPMFHQHTQMNQMTPQTAPPSHSPFVRLRVGDNPDAAARQTQINIAQLLDRLPKEESVPENIPEIRRILASLQETASSAAEPPTEVRSFDTLNVLLQSIQDQARAAQEKLKQAHTHAPGAAAPSNPTPPPLMHGSSPLWSATNFPGAADGSNQPPQMMESIAKSGFGQNPHFSASLWGSGASNSDNGLNNGFQSYFSAFHK